MTPQYHSRTHLHYIQGKYMKKRILPYGAIRAAAEASGYHRVTVSTIVNGKNPWRRCSTLLLLSLHAAGWEPPEGKAFLRQWIRMMSVPVAARDAMMMEEPPVAVTEAAPEQVVADTQLVEVLA